MEDTEDGGNRKLSFRQLFDIKRMKQTASLSRSMSSAVGVVVLSYLRSTTFDIIVVRKMTLSIKWRRHLSLPRQ